MKAKRCVEWVVRLTVMGKEMDKCQAEGLRTCSDGKMRCGHHAQAFGEKKRVKA
jgi:hypothetical protein